MKTDITVPLIGVETKVAVGDVTAMSSYDPVNLLLEQSSVDKRVEHARLKSEALDALKAWRLGEECCPIPSELLSEIHHPQEKALLVATDALIVFEKEHEIEE